MRKYRSEGVENCSEASAPSNPGLFRGIFNNVSGSIVGGTNFQGTRILEERIKSLEDNLNILQDELESKIIENERLVMDCSEARREKRAAELRLEEAGDEVKSGRAQVEKYKSDFGRLERENSSLVAKLESSEITVDGLKRELQLQSEASVKTRSVAEALSQRVSELTAMHASLGKENGDLRSLLVSADSRAQASLKKLEESQAEHSHVVQCLAKERSRGETLGLRISQLEEDLSVMSLQSTGASSPAGELEDNNMLPSCGGDIFPKPCCYRSEHFLSLFRTADLAAKTLASKQKEWVVNMSEMSFLRAQNDQLKQDLNELS